LMAQTSISIQMSIEKALMKLDSDLIIEEFCNVYPPREDTHLLIECIEPRAGQRVLEMGCGSGLLSLHCAKVGAIVVAVDINHKAVDCTRSNLERNHLRAQLIRSDLFSDVEGKFDLILFNPPYLVGTGEDDLDKSWAGGKDGVQILERFLREAPDHLTPGGQVVVLLSSMMREASLTRALSAFKRRRLGGKRLFFEELWVEELIPVVK
jgi:release factor glutamine methyltransferase